MKTYFYLLLTFFITTLSTACLKEIEEPDPCEGLDQSMPEASTTGADIMGCYINGEPWVAYRGGPSLIPTGTGKIDLDYYSQMDGAEITAYKSINNADCSEQIDERFNLYIANVSEYDVSFGRFSNFLSVEAECRYYVDTLAKNKVTITNIDIENNIISFDFECSFISQDDCPNIDTLFVTEGRFDAKYL